MKKIGISVIAAGLLILLAAGLAFGDDSESITISGVIEVEAGYENIDFADSEADDESSSDLALATIELGIDADIANNVKGHVLFLYEDGEDVTVDEGFIIIGGENFLSLYLTAGQIYLPFGNFESNMISDPLTLELGETQETAILAGFEVNGFYGAVYAFNGDIDEDGEESHIDNFGVNAGYTYEMENFSMDAGVGWINNIVDSNGYSDVVDEEAEEAEEFGVAFAFRDYVPGVAGHVNLSWGPMALMSEYVALLEEPEWNISDVEPGSMAALGLESVEEGEKIAAWNIELGYTCSLAGKETTLAVAYQGSRDAEDIWPESRYAGAVGLAIFEGTTLSLEYCRDEFENDDKADVLTAQLSVGF